MKHHRLNNYLLLILEVALLQMIGCVSNHDLAGATTETTNGIFGSIRNSDNTLSPNTIVKLFTEDHDPVSDGALDESCIDTTDVSGTYRFRDVAPGRYSLLARNKDSLTCFLVRNIDVVKDSVTPVTPSILYKAGSFIAKILADLPVDSGNYVYIPGTDIFSNVGSDSSVLLSDIPAGVISAIIFVTSDGEKHNFLQNEIMIVPDDTVTINNPSLTYSQLIILNTSPSGASVSEDLHGFPVLIRLNADNFDFTQARPDGSDLNFTGKGGRMLPYEIELWDASAQRAEIWVRIDTLLCNDSDQSIMMYWGNPEISQMLDNNMVFDTANGFKSVWHLGDSSGIISDATLNSFHGTKHGNLRRSPCIIGNGLIFESGEAYCEMGNVFNPESNNFTVSAWIKRANNGLQTIIAKSNGGDPYPGYGWSLSIDGSNALHCFIANGGNYWGETGTFHFWSDVQIITDFAKWYYVVAVVDQSDSNSCKVYIDGIEVTDNTIGDISGIGSLVNDVAIRIGTESDGGFQFTGSIDEVVISHVVRSQAWIRLCYINQGPDDLLVVFLKEP